MYNRLYFLHIHKTGGTFFDSAILEPEKNNLEKHGISIRPNKLVALSRHWAWHEDLTGNTSYIVAIFRDPVERIVSHFCDWQKNMDMEISDDYPEQINKANLFKFISNYKKPLTNYQSKVILYDMPEINGYIEDKDFINIEFNEEILYSRLDRINLMIRTEDLMKIQYFNKIKNKIFFDINIEPQLNGLPEIFEPHNNPYSKFLLDSLTTLEKHKIYLMNDIDTKIYASNKYFWKP